MGTPAEVLYGLLGTAGVRLCTQMRWERALAASATSPAARSLWVRRGDKLGVEREEGNMGKRRGAHGGVVVQASGLGEALKTANRSRQSAVSGVRS